MKGLKASPCGNNTPQIDLGWIGGIGYNPRHLFRQLVRATRGFVAGGLRERRSAQPGLDPGEIKGPHPEGPTSRASSFPQTEGGVKRQTPVLVHLKGNRSSVAQIGKRQQCRPRKGFLVLKTSVMGHSSFEANSCWPQHPLPLNHTCPSVTS